MAGILKVEDEKAAALTRRYRLPAGHAEVLVERDSLNYLTPLAQMVVGAVRPLRSLLSAYKIGDRLEIPAGVAHDALVGKQGVACLEAHR